MDTVTLKLQAEQHAHEGEHDQAIALYKQVLQADKTDMASCARLAELFALAGHKEQAIRFYEVAAKRYAEQGALPKAVALAKAILTLDPRRTETENFLSKLYANRAPDPEPEPDDELLDVGLETEPPALKTVSYESTPDDEVYFQHAPSLDDTADEVPIEAEPVEEDEEVLLGELVEDDTVEGVVAGVPTEGLLARLPAVPIFSDLSPGEFGRFIHYMEVKQFDPGEDIVVEGEAGDRFYIITSGKADVLKRREDAEVKLATLADGAFFGEFSYLSNAPRSATVRAQERVELLEIARAHMDSLVAEFPRIRNVLRKFFRERMLHTLLNLSPLLKGLAKPELKAILSKLKMVEVTGGQVVIEEGTDGKGLYLIGYGSVGITMKNRWGGEAEVATLGVGDFFGEISLITGDPTTASVTASETAALFMLAKADFGEISKRSPQFAAVLGKYANERMAYNEELKANLDSIGEEGIV